jgi:nucleotide-binding universal stress UspA family protein
VLLIPTGYMYSKIQNITYAFDYFHEHDLPLARLMPFLRALKCELKVLQVMEASYSSDAEDYLKALQFTIDNLYGKDITIQYDTIHSEAIPQSINSYILRNQPDALALCSIHRNLLEKIFHKSIIKHVSAICNYPVLVFHQ